MVNMKSIPNNLDKIKRKINSNELIIGTVITFNDLEVSEVLCSCDYDFIWIDSEHGPLDKHAINNHIMAIRGWGSSPFVRVASNDPVTVKPVLDMGPAGIIFPLIKTVDDVKRAIESCKYPPKGIRGFGPRRANYFSHMSDKDYLRLSENEPWIIIQIETIDAVKNLEKILEIDDVDCIAIGPNDLSGSVGLLGQTYHSKVIELLIKIINNCIEAGVPFFPSIGTDVNNIKFWIDNGTKMLALGTDISHLINSSEDTINKTRNLYKNFKKR